MPGVIQFEKPESRVPTIAIDPSPEWVGRLQWWQSTRLSCLTRPGAYFHRSSKLVLGGASKSFKTWSLIDLGLSVATESDWWGFPTIKGEVLFLNFEVQQPFFAERMARVLKAKGIALPAERVHGLAVAWARCKRFGACADDP